MATQVPANQQVSEQTSSLGVESSLSQKVNSSAKSKVLYVAAGVLVLLTLAVGGYVVYDRFTRTGSEVDEHSEVEDDVEEEMGEDSEVDDEDTPDSETVVNNENQNVDQVDAYKGWKTYMNEAMGFSIKYPVDVVVMERFHQDLGKVNCVDIGPVDGEQKAFIALGYDPVEGFPNGCFRSGFGAGEQKVDEIQLQIGDEMMVGKRLIYTGDGQEQAYTNYIFHLDNPNMDKGKYNYFAVQIEYYVEYEDKYWEMYQNILKTFEWL